MFLVRSLEARSKRGGFLVEALGAKAEKRFLRISNRGAGWQCANIVWHTGKDSGFNSLESRVGQVSQVLACGYVHLYRDKRRNNRFRTQLGRCCHLDLELRSQPRSSIYRLFAGKKLTYICRSLAVYLWPILKEGTQL